jgi:NAD(P)-dependent dehydrogenase (short-subunit alcohol dehydrogenase family)
VELMLRDQVAVVTGASKGIGMAVTEALADEGALVFAAARKVSSLQGLENVTAVAMDLCDPTAPTTLVQRALDTCGRVDILVNNLGGVEVRPGGFLATTDEDFRSSIEMNLFSTLRASRAVLKPMAEQSSGSIVNIGSTDLSVEPDGSTIDYGVAKAAVVNLTRALALEFGNRGIRVNAISPGPVSTDLWLGENGIIETVAALGEVDASALRDSVVASMGGIATGRFTLPEEVAALVAFLASPRAANITGVNYLISR